MRKNNLPKLLMLLLSELICFSITTFHINEYDTQKIYICAIAIVQLFYFIPVLFTSCYLFFCPISEKKLLISTTFFLIVYSIILHFFIKQLAMLFTSTSGILNFVEYASKIYFICLPLLAFQILPIKKETMKKSYFLLLFRIVLLFFITFMFKFLFGLKGILYSWSLCEFLCVLIFFYQK